MNFFWKQICAVAATVVLLSQVFADDVVILISNHKKIPSKDLTSLLASHPQLHKTAYASPIKAHPNEANLLPHRATYAISLHKTFDPEIKDVTGTMTIEISDAGIQWTYEKKTILLVRYYDGTVEPVIIKVASWESKEENKNGEGDGGPKYHFYAKVNRGTEVLHDDDDYENYQEQGALIQGEALMATAQGEGIVTYQTPYGLTARLPVGTVFPMRHTAKLMQEAVNGKSVCSYILFDGENESIAFGGENERNEIVRVNTVITPVAKSNVKFSDPVPFPTDHMWAMHMAIYGINPQKDNPDPDYEISQTMLPHGIIASMIQDFGDFNAELKLTELEFFNE
ncbi:MAG: DUF1849 family protein [Alphaproteobacteria bacterium]